MILVSAGHGAGDPGAVFDDFQEHSEALIWQARIIEALSLLKTPVDRVPVGPLESKIAYINEWCREYPKSLAIEVHFNSSVNPASGCETLYCPGSRTGRALAELVQDALALSFSPDRGTKEGWFRGDPARGPLAFLSRTRCPALIIEPDFVRNAEKIRAYRDRTCASLAHALTQAHFLL